MRRTLHALVAAALLAFAAPRPAPAAEPTVEELLDRTDDFARGESSHGTMTMRVKTDRYERTLTMEAWSEGTERSLIRILEPAKERGVTTLKVDDNIWNYLPKVDRTVKVPAGMMSGAWMGSHITNDDLVKANRLSEDFTYTLTQKPADNPDKLYVIELVPKPDAPVVWGKVVVRVTADQQPHDVRYYDEKGELVRTMSFHDLKEMDGRTLPARFRVTPADAPAEYTEIVYQDIDFDVDIPDATFSLQALRR